MTVIFLLFLLEIFAIIDSCVFVGLIEFMYGCIYMDCSLDRHMVQKCMENNFS